MKAEYADLLYTNDDIRPMLAADNNILVAIQPVNEDIVHFDFYGRDYRIYMLNPECQKLGTLLGRIALIHPVSRRGSEREFDEEEWK